MPIETICQKCSQKLRVADEHAGKTARCPNCNSTYTVPQISAPSFTFQDANQSPFAQPTPQPQAPAAPAPETADPEAVWRLKIEDGRTFGPITKLELDRWLAEGRITNRCEICNDRNQTQVPAEEVYPQLRAAPGSMASGAANPFRESEFNPYASPSGHAAYQPAAKTWYQPHRGALILVFGVLGAVFCALFGIPAVIMGHTDLGKIRNGIMDPEGKGLIIAGLVCGWFGVIQLLFLGCIFGFALLAELS